MKANIFVCDKSFTYNGVDTLCDIQKKIVNLRPLFSVIESKKNENYIYLQHENFLSTEIYSGDTVEHLIFGTEEQQCKIKQKYNRDVINILKSLFNKTRRCSYSYEDMIEVLSDFYEENDNCYGVIAMNRLSCFPKCNQILYDEKGFYRFRRYYIGKLVNDPVEFISQINIYYDNLILNENEILFCQKLSEVIESHGISIIKCLTALSENFKKEYCGDGEIKVDNLSIFLEQFAKRNGLDGGSFEGKNDKFDLQCRFRNKNTSCEEQKELYCGPHLKIYHDDKGRDGQHLRVYFAWDKYDMDYIYVGLITSHVKN